jgi:hypothetical protein
MAGGKSGMEVLLGLPSRMAQVCSSSPVPPATGSSLTTSTTKRRLLTRNPIKFSRPSPVVSDDPVAGGTGEDEQKEKRRKRVEEANRKERET